jgi:prevent-host-death family protein
MTTIGTFEAKPFFSQIIKKVEQGQDYVVTKRGKSVAKIVPFAKKTESLVEGFGSWRSTANSGKGTNRLLSGRRLRREGPNGVCP